MLIKISKHNTTVDIDGFILDAVSHKLFNMGYDDNSSQINSFARNYYEVWFTSGRVTTASKYVTRLFILNLIESGVVLSPRYDIDCKG